MIITHKLKPMDLAQKQNTGRVDVVQGDKYSRNIEFTFMYNGVAWQIPDGTTAIVRYKKPDATGGNYDTLPDGSTAYQINGNVLTVCLAPQVCTVPGVAQLSVGLIQGSAEINTFSINIVVQPNPGVIYQSEDYIRLSGAVPNSGWPPNMYLGTDAFGNVIAKEGTGTVHADIPEYIKAAALEVAKKVRAVQTEESITFIAMSDAHQLDTSSDIVTGNKHAGMAAKALAYILPNIDFACFLGDYTAGSSTTTIDEGKQHFAEINANIDEAFSGIPQFRTVGNHDDLHYSQTQNGSKLTQAELYQYIGSYNDGATVDPNNPQGGYCYRDFADKKLRVICLNTSDNLNAGAITDAQLKWFAQTALDFSGKTSPSDWSFVVIGHHPADWVITPAAVLKAYVGGETYSAASWSKNFSGANSATFLGNFHGHIHNFKAGKLHYRSNTSTSPITTSEFDAVRVAIPNACYLRNNEYGQNSGAEVDDIEYGDVTYNKTAGTAQDTAFCVIVIDRSSKVIHAFCYGAGIDREISYDFTLASYSVTSTLSHVSSSNSTLSVTEGSSYYAELTPEDGYALDSVTVTMGGADITATAYGDGVVSIGAVTGNIVITATAAKVIVPIDLIAEYGYRDGYRMSTSSGNFSAGAGYVAIGYPNAIPVGVADYPNGFVIEVTGANFNSSSHSNCTWAIYQGTDPAVTSGFGEYIRAGAMSLNGVSTTAELTDNGIKWTFPAGLPSYTFLRFAGYGSGANLTGTITPNA